MQEQIRGRQRDGDAHFGPHFVHVDALSGELRFYSAHLCGRRGSAGRIGVVQRGDLVDVVGQVLSDRSHIDDRRGGGGHQGDRGAVQGADVERLPRRVRSSAAHHRGDQALFRRLQAA